MELVSLVDEDNDAQLSEGDSRSGLSRSSGDDDDGNRSQAIGVHAESCVDLVTSDDDSDCMVIDEPHASSSAHRSTAQSHINTDARTPVEPPVDTGTDAHPAASIRHPGPNNASGSDAVAGPSQPLSNRETGSNTKQTSSGAELFISPLPVSDAPKTEFEYESACAQTQPTIPASSADVAKHEVQSSCQIPASARVSETPILDSTADAACAHGTVLDQADDADAEASAVAPEAISKGCANPGVEETTASLDEKADGSVPIDTDCIHPSTPGVDTLSTTAVALNDNPPLTPAPKEDPLNPGTLETHPPPDATSLPAAVPPNDNSLPTLAPKEDPLNPGILETRTPPDATSLPAAIAPNNTPPPTPAPKTDPLNPATPPSTRAPPDATSSPDSSNPHDTSDESLSGSQRPVTHNAPVPVYAPRAAASLYYSAFGIRPTTFNQWKLNKSIHTYGSVGKCWYELQPPHQTLALIKSLDEPPARAQTPAHTPVDTPPPVYVNSSAALKYYKALGASSVTLSRWRANGTVHVTGHLGKVEYHLLAPDRVLSLLKPIAVPVSMPSSSSGTHMHSSAPTQPTTAANSPPDEPSEALTPASIADPPLPHLDIENTSVPAPDSSTLEQQEVPSASPNDTDTAGVQPPPLHATPSPEAPPLPQYATYASAAKHYTNLGVSCTMLSRWKLERRIHTRGPPGQTEYQLLTPSAIAILLKRLRILERNAHALPLDCEFAPYKVALRHYNINTTTLKDWKRLGVVPARPNPLNRKWLDYAILPPHDVRARSALLSDSAPPLPSLPASSPTESDDPVPHRVAKRVRENQLPPKVTRLRTKVDYSETYANTAEPTYMATLARSGQRELKALRSSSPSSAPQLALDLGTLRRAPVPERACKVAKVGDASCSGTDKSVPRDRCPRVGGSGSGSGESSVKQSREGSGSGRKQDGGPQTAGSSRTRQDGGSQTAGSSRMKQDGSVQSTGPGGKKQERVVETAGSSGRTQKRVVETAGCSRMKQEGGVQSARPSGRTQEGAVQNAGSSGRTQEEGGVQNKGCRRPTQQCAMPEVPTKAEIATMFPAKGSKSGDGDIAADACSFRYTMSLGKSDLAWVQRQLKIYNQHIDQVLKSEKNQKPDMQAQRLMNENKQTAPRVYGHIRGVKPGQQFEGKGVLCALGIHSSIGSGICNPPGKSTPCEAIVMSGGYVDDEDGGLEMWYTGTGGRDPKSHAQAIDQKPEKGNLALLNSHRYKTPVRVCRAIEKSAPRMYAYEGLYLVKSWKFVASEAGPKVYKFKLSSIKGHSTSSAKVEFGCFSGGYTKKSLIGFAKRMQLAGHVQTVVKRAPQGTAHKQLVADVKNKTLAWMWDNTPAERRALEESRNLKVGQRSCVLADISHGLEPVRVPVINDHGTDLPPAFEYITAYSRASRSAAEYVARGIQAGHFSWKGCTGMSSEESERHAKLFTSTDVKYNHRGMLGSLMCTTPVVECGGPNCKCNLKNVTERGVHVPLQVFNTGSEVGWGVRCEVDLAPGEHIASYVGALRLSSQCERYQKSNDYLCDLSHFQDYIAAGRRPDAPPGGELTKGELARLPRMPPPEWMAESYARKHEPPDLKEDICWDCSNVTALQSACSACLPNTAPAAKRPYKWTSYKSRKDPPAFGDRSRDSVDFLSVDAQDVGNVARFFNTSCRTNMVSQTVLRRDAGGALLYYLSFFTDHMGVKAMTELTWNYNWDGATDSNDERIVCRCGHPECRGFL